MTAPVPPSSPGPASPPSSLAPPASAPPPRPDRSRLIIDQPRLQGRTQRVVSGAVTAVAWFVWAYLWLPLATLVAWYFGFRTFVREVIIPDSATVLSTGVTYLVIILVLGLILLAWSQYNLRRFGGEDRRSTSAPLTADEVTGWFGISHETLEALRSGGSLLLEHGPDAEVHGVRVQSPAPAGASFEGIEAESTGT
jgi:biofilm PGA synthesis protein PgaD